MKKVMDCFDIEPAIKNLAVKQAKREKISKAELYRRAITAYLLMKKVSNGVRPIIIPNNETSIKTK